MFGEVFNEAIEIFKRKERGRNNYKFCLNDSHPLTLADLKEINSYVDKIWADEEIYFDDGCTDSSWTDERLKDEN